MSMDFFMTFPKHNKYIIMQISSLPLVKQINPLDLEFPKRQEEKIKEKNTGLNISRDLKYRVKRE